MIAVEDIGKMVNSLASTLTECKNGMVSFYTGLDRMEANLDAYLNNTTFETDAAAHNTTGVFDQKLAEYALYKARAERLKALIVGLKTANNPTDLLV